ncbi:MAG: type I methionyl aminopeptidase [Bifidobacteriaceae bacterium]|jgi:methionyl aminopeptidase|nr:type I methionyl aminopeptidase [Bifidobacteriaceae bacterium]
MIELKTPDEIAKIRRTGKEVHRILHLCKEQAKAGTNLLELDELTKTEIARVGGISSYVDYAPQFAHGKPFGHYICTSVNDAVLHGMPFDYKLRKGDLVCLDLAFSIDGWVADSAISFVVDQPASGVNQKLLQATEQALYVGIDQAVAGNHVGDISAAIGRVAKKFHLPAPNITYGGHGVGRAMHEEPNIPNDGIQGTKEPLRAGMVVAIEPWFMATTSKLKTDPDGWTLRSLDGSPTAHFEHTIAITTDVAEVLTR